MERLASAQTLEILSVEAIDLLAFAETAHQEHELVMLRMNESCLSPLEAGSISRAAVMAEMQDRAEDMGMSNNHEFQELFARIMEETEALKLISQQQEASA